jgi:hypothetical protein
VMIPQRSITQIAAVTLPDDFHRNPGFSDLTSVYARRLFERVGFPFDMRLCLKNFPKSHLVSEPAIFEDLDFEGYVEPSYRREVALRISRSARLDGFLLWLNLYAIDYPRKEQMVDSLVESSWLPVFFPVFYPGVNVQAGDVLRFTCRGYLSDNGLNPDYSVEGWLERQGGAPIPFSYESAHHKRVFQENAFTRRLFAANGRDVQVLEAERVEAAVSPTKLRGYLAERLPAHLVPSAFVTLDAMPRLPNGKTNAQALPAPDWDNPGLRDSYVPPGTAQEQELAAQWSSLLGVEQVGIYDDFFVLGGHSLLATQMLGWARKTYRTGVPLRAFFERPTITGLIAAIQQHAIQSVQETERQNAEVEALASREAEGVFIRKEGMSK